MEGSYKLVWFVPAAHLCATRDAVVAAHPYEEPAMTVYERVEA